MFMECASLALRMRICMCVCVCTIVRACILAQRRNAAGFFGGHCATLRLIMPPSASWEVGCYCVCCKSWLPLFYLKHWDAQKLRNNAYTWRKTPQKDETTPQKEEATASKIEETTAQKKNDEWAVVAP